jgi:hypothetical protein
VPVHAMALDLLIACPVMARGMVEGHRVDRHVALFGGVCAACLGRR